MTRAPLSSLAATWLADPSAAWSLGTFGAIAEFVRDADEPAGVELAPAVSGGVARIVTPRGAIAIAPDPAVRPVAFETAIGSGPSWSHAVALCLPAAAAAMGGRTVLAELGPDADAPRAQDRQGVLFDLGLGAWQLDACVRVTDSALLIPLRAGLGRPLFAPGNPALAPLLAAGPPRVFLCRFGRIEVYGPIPAPGTRTADGPHTHILPKLLALGRTHAATSPIPEGWVPCMHLYPSHPTKDQAGRRRAAARPDDHARFQALLARWGDPGTVALKRRVAEAVRRGDDPAAFPAPATRAARAALKVALRQVAAFESPAERLNDWRERFDPPPRRR